MLKLGYRLDPKLTALSAEIDWLKEQAVQDLPNWSWHRLDRVFSGIRRSLLAQTLEGVPNWRYGPDYVHHVAGHTFRSIQPYGDICGKFYLDLGCGAQNPFGTSCVMYLNGARETLAVDQAEIDPSRSAEALFDLLEDCALFPDRWHWSGLSRDEYLRRIGSFNALALRGGDLPEGLRGVPVRYAKADICMALPVEPASVDVIASRDALEHFLDFPSALCAMTTALRRGGLACHHIDLADHRAYRFLDPEDYSADYTKDVLHIRPEFHEWSFLAEDDRFRDGLCNRLRASEFRNIFCGTGYEVLQETPVRKALPPNFRARLTPAYASLSDEDLATTRVTFVLRKAER